MNKELILMLVVSFVVGYIVSEVVRKCGCSIMEGMVKGDGYGGGPDPGSQSVPESMSDKSCNIDPPTNHTCNNWHRSKPNHQSGMCHWSCKDNNNNIRCAEYYTNGARQTVECWEPAN